MTASRDDVLLGALRGSGLPWVDVSQGETGFTRLDSGQLQARFCWAPAGTSERRFAIEQRGDVLRLAVCGLDVSAWGGRVLEGANDLALDWSWGRLELSGEDAPAAIGMLPISDVSPTPGLLDGLAHLHAAAATIEAGAAAPPPATSAPQWSALTAAQKALGAVGQSFRVIQPLNILGFAAQGEGDFPVWLEVFEIGPGLLAIRGSHSNRLVGATPAVLSALQALNAGSGMGSLIAHAGTVISLSVVVVPWSGLSADALSAAVWQTLQAMARSEQLPD